MNLNDLNYQYIKLMTEAEGCSNRKDAVNLLNKATKLKDTIALVKRCLEYYAGNGNKKERAAKFMDRIGVDAFKEAVL